jgi:hypothetical protein
MKFPVPGKDIPEFQAMLQAIPRVLEQAKKNLTEDAKDLWFLGIRVKKRESTIRGNLAKRLAELHPNLVADAERARAAVDEFFASGIIPVSLIRWEMTGLDDEIKKLW